ncbi:MAG: penicillin-binding protein 2 [candidate division Zixibacteria bacterium]|nr:penicillin-binding protein 2 [candidate division Zixibacteria bacterium]
MTRPSLGITQRFTIGVAFAGFFLVLLLGRMLFLQTVRHQSLYAQSESNRIRVQPIVPMRGTIFDRDRRPIIANRGCYSLYVIPEEAARSGTLGKLAPLLSTDLDDLQRRIRKNQIGRYQPALIQRDVDFEDVAVLEEQNESFPGAHYSKDQVRMYTDSLKSECFTGYVGEVSSEELAQLDPSIYRSGALIGKAGIEKQYDRQLRGMEGAEYLEVAASGQLLGVAIDQPYRPPEAGTDLILTIDNDVQKAAAESFGEFCCGAAVAIDPRNGEVLAMVSNPSNDAGLFSGPIPDSAWKAILADSTNPLLNRPINGLYPPGSTYKLMIAGAALESGLITPESRFSSCGGGYRFGNRVFKCWRPEGHGSLGVIGAIEQSCDVFFYQVGYRLGIERFAEYSTACGFGRKTGIDLPRESSGLVPSKDWYDRKLGAGKWTAAVLLNLGIGQGELLVTPLQLAQFYCGLANNGRVYRPHLIKAIVEANGREADISGAVSFTLPFSESTLQILRAGLTAVVEGGSGTARGARINGVTVGGKTGTAQNPHGEDHAWFVGLAPVEAPEIVACVLVENAGHGSTWAAPAVRKILMAYLKKHNLVPEDLAVVKGE